MCEQKSAQYFVSLIFFFLRIYKMVNITKETYENNDIEVIIDRFGKLWLNEKHVEQQLGHKNLPTVRNKYDEKYKKCRYKIIDEPKKNNHIEDLYAMIWR